MGDRAGGLSFWGRKNVAIFQTEGLTFNIEYLKARVANQAERFLESLPIQYFVIDREVIPKVVGADGRTQFVIAEPIQGRINSSPVPTFCFPLEAVQYEYAYRSVYGVNTRMAFNFAARQPCSQEALTLIRTVEGGVGLRQFSLPGEYDPREGGMMNKAAEDRDRLYAKSSSTTRQP
jgi:hypothetical protein